MAFVEKMQLSVYFNLQINEYIRFRQAEVLPKVSENVIIYSENFAVIDRPYCASHHWFFSLTITSLDKEENILVLA